MWHVVLTSVGLAVLSAPVALGQVAEEPVPSPEPVVVAPPVVTPEPAPVEPAPAPVEPAPADEPEPAPAPAPAEAAPAPVQAASPPPVARAAQPPPPEPTPPPDEPTTSEPETPAAPVPPASDPSCVFPQPYAPDTEPCQALATQCNVLGTPGNDMLVGDATAELICGLGGDDTLDGGGGDDVLLGGDGDDRLTGGDGADCLLGQAGEDEFVEPGDDIVIEDYEIGNVIEGEVGVYTVGLDEEGHCVPGKIAAPEAGGGGSGGSLAASLDTADVVYGLAQVLGEVEAEGGGTVEFPDTARAGEGVVRILLTCEATVTGTLELFQRRDDQEVPVGEEAVHVRAALRGGPRRALGRCPRPARAGWAPQGVRPRRRAGGASDDPTRRAVTLLASFKRLHPAYKTVISLVAPIGTVIATLLALNVIQPFGADALAASADRTAEAATAAVNLRYETDDGVAFRADGDFDYRADRGSLRYDFSGTEGAGDLRGIEAVFAGREVYLRLAGGQKWIHADLDAAGEQLADFAEADGDEPPAALAPIQDLGLNDPSQVLASLRRASEVSEQGEETIFGVATTRYGATIEPQQEGEQRLAVTAWIDGSGLIRRLALEGEAFTMTMEFTEFGKPVDVETPAPGDVRELQEVLQSLT